MFVSMMTMMILMMMMVLMVVTYLTTDVETSKYFHSLEAVSTGRWLYK